MTIVDRYVLGEVAIEALFALIGAPAMFGDLGPEMRDGLKQEVGNTIALHLAQQREPNNV